MTAALRPARRIEGLGVTMIRRMLALAPPGAINLGIGQTDGGVPDFIARAVCEAPSLRRAPYELNAGSPALRARIGARYGVGAEQVLVTCGVQEALALALLGLVDPGDEVLVPDPSFLVYATLTRIAGGTPVLYSTPASQRMRPRWDDIEPLLGPRTRLVIVSSPGNPTGAVAETAQWAAIAGGLAARGIPYLSDEIYLDLQPPGGHGSLWSLNRNGIVVSGLSKTHGLAGWRLGWMVVPPEIFDPMAAFHQHLVTSASTLVQDGAMAAFTAAGEVHAARVRDELLERRAIALDVCARAGLDVVAGDGAFYLFVGSPGGSDDVAFARSAVEHAGVITIPGSAFGPTGAGHLRLSYSVPPDRFAEGVARLVDHVTRFAR